MAVDEGSKIIRTPRQNAPTTAARAARGARRRPSRPVVHAAGAAARVCGRLFGAMLGVTVAGRAVPRPWRAGQLLSDFRSDFRSPIGGNFDLHEPVAQDDVLPAIDIILDDLGIVIFPSSV